MLAFCSTMKMVRPASWICSMRSKFCFTRAGASPMEGSSISSTLGLDMSARPMATICCSPPESVPDFWLRRSLTRGNSSNTHSMSEAMPSLSLRR